MKRKNCLWLGILGLVMFGGAAKAQVVNPTSATASSTFAPGATDASLVTIATDLNSSNEHIGDGTWRSWLSAAPTYQNEQWIVVDLGAEYDPGAIRIWNYHEVAGIETSGRGIKDYSLWVGGTGATLPTGYSDGTEPIPWDKFSALAGWTNVVSGGMLAKGPSSLMGPNTYPCNNTISTTATGVRYIGVDAGTFNHDGGDGAVYTGLAQIQAVLPIAPVVTNAGATNITTVAATLQGEVTAGLPFPQVTTYWGLVGDITNMIDTGTQSTTFSNSISGLTQGTTYAFYFVASNIVGTANSTTGSFTTAAAAVPPVVTNTGAANVWYTTATLQGTVTAGDPTPTVTVNWWPAGGSTTAVDMSTQSGAFSTDLSGLSEYTTYSYYCTASNSAGTSTSATNSFTTGVAGTLITPVGATASSFFGARLPASTVNGSGMSDANGSGVVGDLGDTHLNDSTEGLGWTSNSGDYPGSITFDLGAWYDFDTIRLWNWNYDDGSTAFGIAGMDVLAGPDLGSMVSHGNVLVPEAPGVDSYAGTELVVSFNDIRYIRFNITSNHAGGAVSGLSEVRFQGPPQAPAVTHAGATNITSLTATLQGLVTAGLPLPQVSTYWGPVGNITNMIDNGTQSLSFSNNISGLALGTAYAYYFVASNAVGSATSTTGTFSTAAIEIPAAVTNTGATNVWLSTATLQGAVTAGDPTPDVAIYWWPFGGGTNAIDMGSQSGAFATNISGLLGNTTYSYYCYATNSVGVDTSATVSFTTDLPTITPTVADVSTELTGFGRVAVSSVNGTGMTDVNGSGIVGDAGDTHDNNEGSMWTANGNLGASGSPATNDFDPYITYDLGGIYDVSVIREWGYNSALAIGPDSVDVYTSSDGVTFTFAGTVAFALAPGTVVYGGHAIPVNYQNVRYIKFDIMTTHDGAVFDGTGTQAGTDGRSLTGLAEIRFQGLPAGDPVLTATVASVSSEDPGSIDRDADYTVDGSGLTDANASGYLGDVGDSHINLDDPAYSWTTVGNLGPIPATDFAPYIIYDLGNENYYNVSGMRIWNANQLPQLGARDVDVSVGATLDRLQSQGTFTFAPASGLAAYTGQDIPVSFRRVRYIKFDILTNHDGAVFDGTGAQAGTDGRSLVGLAEVRFQGRVFVDGTLLIVR